MAKSIAGALSRLKRDPLGVVGRGVVERVCAACGYDGWRDRELDPATTVALFVQQVVHGNCPCAEVRHLGGCRFTAPAYCQARARLPLRVYQSLLTEVIEGAALPRTREAGHLWLGRHRTFHVDGSTFSMPDTPALRRAFGVPSGPAEGCGFPVAHLLVLFSAATGLLLDAWASPLRTGDPAQVAEAHPHLDRGDVLVGDDSFGTYAHLALLLGAGLHGLFPVHHRRTVDFTPGRPHCPDGRGAAAAARGVPRSRWVKRLGHGDQLVQWLKPRARPAWMTARQYDALPASITVRELRRTVTRAPGWAA